MSDKTIRIIYGKEKRSLINKIKRIAFNRNGIIFGGLVRDEIIATYYREEFITKKLNFKKYWDKDYHPETNKRLLIPKDVDIYFRDASHIPEFIDDIKAFVQLFNGFINIHDMSNSTNIRHFNYSLNIRLKHTKLYISFILGKTISYSGTSIRLEIDIISNNDNSILDIEPPFYNLDFHSNIFIMEKQNGIVNLRPSNCTGTPLDTMNFFDKSKNCAKILCDIVNLRTQFIGNNTNSIYTEYINCYRIIKMIDRGEYSWDITNVPFTPITILEEDEDDRCCICLENYKKEQSLISITTNSRSKNILHRRCFISYLKEEQRKKYRNDNNLIEIRCPFRNPFNFKDCFKNVNYI